MTNRIEQLFQKKNKDVLAIFYTAGYPGLHDTSKIAEYLTAAGADILEIGFPFSDSLVDGPTIQLANEKALSNGMTIDLYLQQITAIRAELEIPIVAMCCFNPILQYGVERFCKAARAAGIDGAIIADLPADIYERDFQKIFKEQGLCNIMLVTSHTPDSRIRYLDELSSGFVYVVSSDAITGSELSVNAAGSAFFNRLKSSKLKNPLLVGFGISNRKSYLAASQDLQGGIVGSAFIRLLDQHGADAQAISKFVHELKGISA